MTTAMTYIERAILPTENYDLNQLVFADSYTVQMAVFDIRDFVQYLPDVQTPAQAAVNVTNTLGSQTVTPTPIDIDRLEKS